MALNEIPAFINPTNSFSKGVSQSTSTTSTVYTAAANDRVSSFSVSTQFVGTAGTDFARLTVTIGSAKFTVMANSNSGFGEHVMVTSDDLGFKGGYLQAGDTITFQTVLTGSPIGEATFAVAIDNYTA